MNKTALAKINKLKQQINHLGRKEGFVKIYPNNSYIHEKTKFDVCYLLKQKGCYVYTECEFISGGRPDIICFNTIGDGYIIEILNSESKKLFSNKLKKYPLDFEIIEIQANDFKEEDLFFI